MMETLNIRYLLYLLHLYSRQSQDGFPLLLLLLIIMLARALPLAHVALTHYEKT
jgi:hypothetical protein